MQTPHASIMPESHLQLDNFYDRWKQLSQAVSEMAPYARMINQVGDVMEESFDCKNKLREAIEELEKTKAEQEKLGGTMQEMIKQFEARVANLQGEHSSQLHTMETTLRETKAAVATSCLSAKEFEQRCASLERDLDSQTQLLSEMSAEHERLKSSLGLMELDVHL